MRSVTLFICLEIVVADGIPGVTCFNLPLVYSALKCHGGLIQLSVIGLLEGRKAVI